MCGAWIIIGSHTRSCACYKNVPYTFVLCTYSTIDRIMLYFDERYEVPHKIKDVMLSPIERQVLTCVASRGGKVKLRDIKAAINAPELHINAAIHALAKDYEFVKRYLNHVMITVEGQAFHDV